MSELTEFRKMKDEYFGKEPDSPLTLEQKENFSGLKYFPENSDLSFVLDVERAEQHEHIEIQTSKGDTRVFDKFGKIRFVVESKDVELTIFSDANGFFLPFKDSLAGKETYPSGRYLEVELLDSGKLRVDFNMAYNPYCAYNERWSCPLTPFENVLKAPIKAGEKIYHK